MLVKVAGTDASKQFHQFHSDSVLARYGKELEKGVLGSAGAASSTPGDYEVERVTDDRYAPDRNPRP